MSQIVDVDFWSDINNWSRIGKSNYVGGPVVNKPSDWDAEAKIQRGGNLATYKGATFNTRDVPSGKIQYASFSDNPSILDKLADVALPLALMFVPGLQTLGASIGAAVAPAAAAATQAAIGSALVQGTLSQAQGGKFLEGAVLSGLGSIAGGFIKPELVEALGGGVASNIATDALIGGGVSDLSGGSFKQGAVLAGIGSGVNQAKLAAASDYLDSLSGGQGPYTDDLPDMSDFDLPPAVIDTSFTPDYSLFSGAPVVPDMGAQGIQVPTITELVDVVGSPVDYSLSIPSGDGLGLQMPTAPTDLGDPNSFINQPAPDVSVNIPELLEATPKDIDAELGLLNAAKGLAPVVVGSLLADKVLNQQDDQPTGFGIVPIPGDWRSPEYNQTFTPSEAIDFGDSLGQFTRQAPTAAPSFYNLSDVINTLNFQSVPFTQQQVQMPQQTFEMPDILRQFQAPNNMGMNDIIGEIDGTPMTLNSIIAGIQSQYG